MLGGINRVAQATGDVGAKFSGSDMRAALRAQGLSLCDLASEIEQLTGHRVALSTLSRSQTGASAVNPFLAAYLILREQYGAPKPQR